MTTETSQPTAQIIPFPIGGRRALDNKRDDAGIAAELRSARASAIACGSGWYHDAAIQDAKRTGER